MQIQKEIRLTGIKIFFVLCCFFTTFSCAFADKEQEVIKRYDYSSPRASFESLKKATQNKDIEGVLIHDWENWKQGHRGESFEDFLLKFTKNNKNISLNSLETSPITYKLSEEEAENLGKVYSDDGYVNIREFDLPQELDESEKTDNDELGRSERSSFIKSRDGSKRLLVCFFNYDGTREWWTLVQRLGE